MLFLCSAVVITLTQCGVGVSSAQSVHDVGDYDYHYGDYNYNYNYEDPSTALGQRTPSISWITKQQAVDIGSSVNMTCSVQYAQDFPVLWVKRNTNDTQILPISTGTTVILRNWRYTMKHVQGSPTYTLQIKDIQESDGAEYMCQIILGINNRVSASTNLIVRRPSLTTPINTTTESQDAEVIPNCYVCDNYPDTVGEERYDPYCGMDGYQGGVLGAPTSYLVKTCFTSIHYDGSHRVIRDASKQFVVDGLCYDSGFAVTCSCTPSDTRPYCNTDLCQFCDIPKPNN